jgi:G3E family GTPase
MERPQPNPLPITIITGFLGSGKTTLLNRILNGNHGLRVAVLVNDFGAINIDSELIVGVEGETISLSNGCICCTIRDDLLDAVFKLILSDNAPQYIVIETSGVSDPFTVAQTFLMPELRPYVQVDAIVTLVDAEQARDLKGEQELLAMDQISAADILLLNKVDLVSAAQLQEVKTWIRAIVPKARIYETENANVPLELILSVGDFTPERLVQRAMREVHVHGALEHDGHAHDHTTVFSTWTYSVDEPINFTALRDTIQNLPTTIYRAKGFLYLNDYPDNKCVLHVVGRRATMQIGEKWGEQKKMSRLVFIASNNGIDPQQLEALMDSCRATRAEMANDEKNSLAMKWLRKSRKHP